MTITPDKLLRLLADSTRLRSLMLLLRQEELCVCELTYALGEIQPKVSRHLASLRDMHVVIDRRAGQWIYYRINPDLPRWAFALLEAALEGSQQDRQYLQDMEKLQGMPNRPDNRICA